ncbi:OmpA family protein [Salipiger sp. PrR002]|uniref:OmpA family protein n=1 Tax=Salipiger sp. PrR002 TaxID=2706489 RepID=UPI0013BC4AE6|nr:OmpA family protein [Salipiger sp. PrR002]NDV99613.1 OmpA family protein [Salipiger sp. PrR002]NDW57259.1 OmpA family protein [Salipiger sp. PrR004]
MTKGLLKSTTMLALAASLAMPAAAQSNDGADCAKTPDAPACAPENAQQKGEQAKGDQAKGDQAKAKQGKGDEKPGKAKKAEADAAAETAKDAGGKQAKGKEQPAEPAATQTAEEPAEDAPKAKAEASAEADAAQGKKAKQAQKASEPGIAEGEASTAAAAESKLDAETQASKQATKQAPEPAPEQTQDAQTADSQPKEQKAQQDAEAKTQAPKAESAAKAPAAGAAAATEQTAPADGDVASDDLAKKLEAQQDGTVEAEADKKPKAQQTTEAPTEAPTAAEAAPAPKADAQAETTAAPTAETKSGGDVKAEDLANELGGKDPEAQDAPRAADSQQVAPEQTAPEQTAAEQTGEQPAPEQEAPKQQSAEAQAEAVARQDKQEAKVAAAAASDSDSSEAELTEETLTDADVRSSDEDFATDLQSRQEADTQKREERAEKDDDDDEDGLSNFEKAALLGLGTFALSQMIGDDAQVVQNTGDRVVVEENGQYRVLRNDDVLLRQPGSDVKTYRYDDGSTRTVVAYDDGTMVETIKAADGRVLRRARILPDGQQVMLFDDTQQAQDVVVSELPQARTQRLNFRDLQGEDLAAALAAQEAEGVNRAFSLNQIRNIDRVRHLVPEISVDTVTFPTNSAAIRPGEAEELAALGNAMKRMIEQNPSEVFLIEGHTDATGSASYNLALSDRRAESVALALTEYFDVPPSNMVLQGYGESDLAVQSQGDERENRRAAVRRITTLLQGD